MYEKFIKPNAACVEVLVYGFAAVLFAHMQSGMPTQVMVAVAWLGIGVYRLALRYGQRLKALESELAALRAQLAATPQPGHDAAPGRG